MFGLADYDVKTVRGVVGRIIAMGTAFTTLSFLLAALDSKTSVAAFQANLSLASTSVSIEATEAGHADVADLAVAVSDLGVQVTSLAHVTAGGRVAGETVGD